MDTIIKLYDTEMEAANRQAEVKDIKVDMFVATVKVNTATHETYQVSIAAYGKTRELKKQQQRS